VAVLQQVAQRLALGPVGDLGGIEAQEERAGPRPRRAGRLAVGDQDLLDPLGVRVQRVGQAQRPPLAEAA
jgi:hypothetical protein